MITIDRRDHVRYTEGDTPVTAEQYWALLRGQAVEVDGKTLTIDDGPFYVPFEEIAERGGPGSGHHGHEGRPGEVGGSKPSGRGRQPISIPRFKSKQEAIDFINENFMGYDRLGTLLIEEEELAPEYDRILTIEDYIEIAEAFALIQSKFPNLATGRDLDEYGEVDLLWNFFYPNGQGSYYENATSGAIYINTEQYASLEEQYRNMLKRNAERGYVGDSELVREEYESIVERLENLNDPEARKRNHSRYWVPNLEEDQFRSSMLHEFGHYIHVKSHSQDYEQGLPGSFSRNNTWEEDYGVTIRATDSWRECMAENFALWALGETDALHPDIVRFFDDLSERYGG